METRNGVVCRAQRLADDVVQLWRFAANSRPLSYLIFLVLYTVPTVNLARHKLFWDDEFFTLYLSTTRNWKELIEALSTGADQHPPSFYYLTHLIVSVFGVSHVTLRLTAIAGFALLCICLYEIAGRLLNMEWGFCAMLLPLATSYSWYSVEARGYGIETGFVAFAFLMWMLASANVRRGLTIPLLAAGIGAAVASHYYAVLALAPLAGGELARTAARRKVDWPVWIAFSGALVPVGLFLKVVSAHTRTRGISGPSRTGTWWSAGIRQLPRRRS